MGTDDHLATPHVSWIRTWARNVTEEACTVVECTSSAGAGIFAKSEHAQIWDEVHNEILWEDTGGPFTLTATVTNSWFDF